MFDFFWKNEKSGHAEQSLPLPVIKLGSLVIVITHLAQVDVYVHSPRC